MRLIQALLVLCGASLVAAADVPGAADHPLIPRYEGSEIVSYESLEYTDHRLLTGAFEKPGGLKTNPQAGTSLEGKLTRLTYRAPAKRSPLEIFRNYESSLKQAGFQIIFSCGKEACGGREFNHTATPKHYFLGFAEYYAEQRYLAAKLARPEGDVYASLYVVLNRAGGGPNKDRAMIQLDALEMKPMETRMVVLDAGAMQRDLATEGRVAVYGILFDFDKDTMRPDSKPQLEEIAKLLSEAPALKVLIVRHTDGEGGYDHNLDLSRRRAASVVQALVGDYGVERGRMQPVGVGMAAPIASNRSEDGRTLNRRVEIVELPQ